nr:inositol monophosphatase family protein [Pyrinomonadaceae bacterium]
MLENELQTALLLAEKASRSILKFYETDIVAEEKLGADNEYEPVTEADREASRIIVAGLVEAFPNDAILSEEESDDTDSRLSNRRVWIIDPIDGTAGFVKKDGDFSVQIGLAIDGEAAVGVVMQPFHNIVPLAAKGSGPFIKRGDSTPPRM